MTISTIARAIDPVVAVRDVPAPDAIEGLAEALTLDNASGRGRRRDIATAMRLVARNLRARALAAESAAAQWAKVAPLIEALRHTRRHTKPEFVVAAIDALLAATEDVP